MADNIPTLHCAKLFLTYPAKIAQYGATTDGKSMQGQAQDEMNFSMLLHGIKRMTSAASCVLPAKQSAIFEYVRDGRIDEARAIFHDKLGPPLNSIAFANALQSPQC